MNRWINADALHDMLKTKQKWVVRCGDKHNEGYTYDQVHFAIDDAPSIDLITCVECKFKRLYDGETKYYYCALEDRPNRNWSVDDWNYCYWGERRESE